MVGFGVIKLLKFCLFLRFQVIYNRDTERSRGFGFVSMSSVEEADKAVELFNSYVSFFILFVLLGFWLFLDYFL